MPVLQNKKIGIITCSGEELAEGLAARLVALRVLHELRPGKTVTLCLPLFLAGGQGDRAFAKLYPTIAIDGCEKRCAFRATEMYSNKPAGSFMISEINSRRGGAKIDGLRKLNPVGQVLVNAISDDVARSVDLLLVESSDQSIQIGTSEQKINENTENTVGTCSCGSQIPVMILDINGEKREMVALPLIFENFAKENRPINETTADELLEQAGVYTPIEPGHAKEYKQALIKAYKNHIQKEKKC
jgi:uncharacterized metal-binding protein